ncbi:mechanosensitive ion channel [Luteimonas viscosa]|uniref:Mechanosensitive ion channel n=1 Tax=Luteimonas viscosa TaxID=1132694 RepID=A0A5D4XQ84_9GAMM|nr:mechanosensitive ion channel domain-containing protein [Luteimonas viscosa]TYT26113.1 mechanosensitive ion channel [Luteimonas viscosa]
MLHAVAAAAPSQAAAAAGQARDGVGAVLGYAPLQAFGLGGITIGAMIAALVVLVVAWVVSQLLQRAIARYGGRSGGVSQPALYTVSRLAHYVLITIGFLAAMNVAGMPLSQFAVFAGAIGVGLGFGLQAIFSNFVSGLILLFDRSLKVGDFVELDNDIRGVVRAINIRSTLITTNDAIDVLVPNSEFVSGRVVNWTHGTDHRRIRVPFGVAYGTDKLLVKKAALEAAARVPFTLANDDDRRPQVWLVNFGDSAVEYILAVWLTEEAARRNAAIRAAYLWELDTALHEHGIEIPFPQRDLHLRSAFGRSGEDALALLRGQAPGRDEDDAPARAEASLPREERARLARNDAGEDTRRAIEEDAREAELREQQASTTDAGAPGTRGASDGQPD